MQRPPISLCSRRPPDVYSLPPGRWSFAKTRPARTRLIYQFKSAKSRSDDDRSALPGSAPPFLFGGHHQLALENLALRQQPAVYERTVPRPPLCRTDRLFWVGLARVWARWRQSLVIVTPNTVLRWQRRRVRDHWTKLCPPAHRGRPPVIGVGLQERDRALDIGAGVVGIPPDDGVYTTSRRARPARTCAPSPRACR
jgi:hypothetical protein